MAKIQEKRADKLMSSLDNRQRIIAALDATRHDDQAMISNLAKTAPRASYRQIDKEITNSIHQAEIIGLLFDRAYFRFRGDALLFSISSDFFHLMGEENKETSTYDEFRELGVKSRQRMHILFAGAKAFAERLNIPFETLFACSEVVQKKLDDDKMADGEYFSDEDLQEIDAISDRFYEDWKGAQALI